MYKQILAALINVLLIAVAFGHTWPRAAAQSTPPVLKILVDQDGMVSLTGTALAEAGVTLAGLDASQIHLSHLGSELAVQLIGLDDGSFDPQDQLLFYGERNRTRYSDASVYWLEWGGSPGLRMASADAAPGSDPLQTSYRHTERIEQNLLYQPLRASGPDSDHWYWQSVSASSGRPVTRDYPISLASLAPTGSPARVQAILYGTRANPQHHTVLTLNGVTLDDAFWSATSEHDIDAELPHTSLIEGTNTFRLSIPLDSGIVSETVLVNWFEVSYDRLLTASNGALYFGGNASGEWRCAVDGFASDDISVYDLTNPKAPVRLLNASVEASGGGYRAVFQCSGADGARFATLENSALHAPLAVTAATPSTIDLRSPGESIDYIMIAPADFLPALEPLAAYHRARGLNVLLADVAEIYDAFSYGQFDPQAIHDFLAYAHDNYPPPAPQYVLLAGDGNYDFKDYRGTHQANYVPPYLAMGDPWAGEVPADNRYVTFDDGDILPDMHLGRITARNVEETSAVVSKILTYAQTPAEGGWNTSALYIADDIDAGEEDDFAAASDQMLSHLPGTYTARKVYLENPYPITEARSEILNQINAGQLLVNYTGHSSVDYWATENLFHKNSVAGLTNGGKLPFFLGMDCLEGNYFHLSVTSDGSALAEMLVRAPNGGAIAAFSPVGMGLTTDHMTLNQGLFEAIFEDGVTRLGPATTQAKRYLSEHGRPNNELIDTYLLFGDPALHLNVPQQADLRLKVTLLTEGEIHAGQPVTLRVDYFNAGQRAAKQVRLRWDAAAGALGAFTDPASGAAIPLTSRSDIALPDVPAGGGGSITLRAVVKSSFTGALPVSFTILTDTVETVFVNNTAGLELTVLPPLEPTEEPTVEPSVVPTVEPTPETTPEPPVPAFVGYIPYIICSHEGGRP